MVSSKCCYSQALPDLFSDTKKTPEVRLDEFTNRNSIHIFEICASLDTNLYLHLQYPRFHCQFQRYGCITLGVTLKNLNHRELGAFWDFLYYLSHTVPLVSFVFVFFWPKDDIARSLWLSQLSAGGSGSIKNTLTRRSPYDPGFLEDK